MKIKQMNLPWFIIEMLSVAVFSFLGSFILSSITILLILSMYLPGEGGPGDGLGVLIILFFVVIPIWFIVAIIGPIYARFKFTGKYAFEKRVLFSLLLPTITTIIASGIASTIMFMDMYG